MNKNEKNVVGRGRLFFSFFRQAACTTPCHAPLHIHPVDSFGFFFYALFCQRAERIPMYPRHPTMRAYFPRGGKHDTSLIWRQTARLGGQTMRTTPFRATDANPACLPVPLFAGAPRIRKKDQPTRTILECRHRTRFEPVTMPCPIHARIQKKSTRLMKRPNKFASTQIFHLRAGTDLVYEDETDSFCEHVWIFPPTCLSRASGSRSPRK